MKLIMLRLISIALLAAVMCRDDSLRAERPLAD